MPPAVFSRTAGRFFLFFSPYCDIVSYVLLWVGIVVRFLSKKTGHVSRVIRDRRGGISRAAVILLVLIAVMLVVIAIPNWNSFRKRSAAYGCRLSLNTAGDAISIETIMGGEALTVGESREIIARSMPGRDRLCPSGGDVYFLSREDGTYDLVCGLHAEDTKLRAKLNAVRAKTLAERELARRLAVDGALPETLTITINGGELTCVFVDEAVPLRRGTKLSGDYEGIVAFFGVEGAGGWRDTGAAEDELCYFLYADEDWCAKWNPRDDWTGDCFS